MEFGGKQNKKVNDLNKKDLWLQRNKTLQLVDITKRGKRNAVYLGANESKVHALKKAELCWELKRRGKEFYTEAIFEGNTGRADVLVLDDNYAIEVVESESEASMLKKKRAYPCEIVVVNVKDAVNKVLGGI